MGQVQSDKTRSKEQCYSEAWRGDRLRYLFDTANETSHKLGETIRKRRSQYEQVLADPRYVQDVLKALGPPCYLL